MMVFVNRFFEFYYIVFVFIDDVFIVGRFISDEVSDNFLSQCLGQFQFKFFGDFIVIKYFGFVKNDKFGRFCCLDGIKMRGFVEDGNFVKQLFFFIRFGFFVG